MELLELGELGSEPFDDVCALKFDEECVIFH